MWLEFRCVLFQSVTLVYEVVGEGTREFSKLTTGDNIRISSALRNGYNVQEAPGSILVGGGIGVPPLV